MSWSEKTLDQLGYVSRGKSRHRPRDAAHLYGGEYPFVQTADVKHAGLYLTEFSQTYSEEGLAQSKLWPAGTLCITIAANIADTAILGIDACFPDSVIGFIPNPDKADARFVKYLFDAVLKLRYRQFTQGAAQDNLSQEKLLALKFLVPDDVTEQTRIADVIANYDVLIDTNKRRIQLLEESARLLYQEWFIQQRFPGHEQVKFTDNLPEGWSQKPLSELCVDVRDAVQPGSVKPETPYIGLEHIPRRSITLSTWESSEKVTSTKLLFRKSDILFGKIRPYFHKIGFTICDGITSSDSIVIRPTNQIYYDYLLMYLSSDFFIALASKTCKEGSKMPRANWDYLLTTHLLVPNDALIQQFSTHMQFIRSQLEILAKYNKSLAQARDTLLPKLMSGELTV